MNLRLIAIAGLVAVWASAAFGVLALPSTVPLRWDGAGHVSAMGSKYTLLILPLAGTFAWGVIALASRISQPVKPAIDALKRALLAIVLAELTWAFAIMEAQIVVSSASGHLSPVLGLTMGAFTVVLVGTIAVFLMRVLKVKAL